MKIIIRQLSLLCVCTIMWSSLVHAQGQFDHRNYYSESSYSVTTHEDLRYGIGSTNYYRYKGTGDQNTKSNYNLVSQQTLTIDMYEPNTQSGSDKRAVLILLPGSGRNGCRTSGACDVDTIVESSLSSSTAQYVSQEGDNYNELNSSTASNYAKRGIIAISPITRYQYQNRQLDDTSSWSQDDGSDLFNGSSFHLEPLVVDIKRLVRWLSHPDQVAQYNIDPDNIFILGSSGASKMASLATITDTDLLLADEPAQLNSNHEDYQFEVDNNNLLVPQRPLRGAIMLAGDTNGTRNLQLMNPNTGAFMFWQGTTDRSIEHGFAETIEEKCEYVGCATQFYSLPGVEHSRTASGKSIHTEQPSDEISLTAHAHDFIVNHLKKDTQDTRPVLSISHTSNQFSESAGKARVKLELSEASNVDISFTMAADQMREVMLENGSQGEYDLVQAYVANDESSTGPIVYDQSTGVVFELTSNLPSAFSEIDVHSSGPGEGNPVVIPQNSNYFYDDFVGKKQVLTIPAGQTSATFSVDIIDDSLHEENECFKVRLLNATNAQMTNTVETIVILDDDNPNASSSAVCGNYVDDLGNNDPIISITNVVVDESKSSARVIITMSPAQASKVNVDYQTQSVTAVDGQDYVGRYLATMTFSPGQISKVRRIDLIDDVKTESDETLELQLSNPQGAVLGNSVGIITINDND